MKKIYGIRVSQPLGDFFIAKIKAKDLLEISTSSVARYNKEGKLVGNQRPLKLPRLKAIANFIKSAEMCFPTSILVAANVDNEGNIIEEQSKRWSIHPTSISDCFEIKIPSEVSSLIIDGQHRLNAFSYTEEQFKDIELVCSIFLDLHNPYQAYLFATINGNQKRVDKSLALELFGYDVEDKPSNTWSPEKLAVYLTRKFNFRKDSPLREAMVRVYKEMYGKEPVIQAIHAGLECGLLAGKISDLDAVSIGPDMVSIHTTEEKLSISSTKRVWDYIVEVIRQK